MFRAALVFEFPDPYKIVKTVDVDNPPVAIRTRSLVSPILYLT